MIFAHTAGGLGNQLFQVFAILSHCIENRFDYVFYNDNVIVPNPKRPVYWDNILSSLKSHLYLNNNLMSINFFDVYIQNENIFTYNKISVIHHPNERFCYIYSYCQSEKYFKHHYSEVIELLNLKEQRKHMGLLFPEYSNSISMHFRVGDYKNNSNINKYVILPITYYKNALRYLMGQLGNSYRNVVFFFEIEDRDHIYNMISELYREFPMLNFIAISTNLVDWQQLLIMSNCHHHIIANSSFSWWGSYLADYPNKITCYPDQWFGPELSHLDTKDLIPDTWIKCSSSEEIIPDSLNNIIEPLITVDPSSDLVNPLISKYYFSIGCVFKNEAHILYEFIEYYFAHGVDHIYMINDFSDDDYMSVLDPYLQTGRITLFHNDIVTYHRHRQSMIYNKYFQGILKDTFWIGILDLDEFLYSSSDVCLTNILKKWENDVDYIKVEWVSFGSNQFSLQPFSVISAFDKCCDLNSEINKKHYSYKSIMKACLVEFLDIHISYLSSYRCVNLSYTDGVGELFVNHYRIQSLDFYMRIKTKRGDCDNYYQHEGRTRDLEEFKMIDADCNMVVDRRLIEQNTDLIRKVKQYKISRLIDKDVTVVITSCNRAGLLKLTMDSFLKYNTYPIKEFIIIDDSGIAGVNDFLVQDLAYSEIPIKLIYNVVNIGQIKSVDKAYEYVTTSYIFHCEEDWEFLRPGFIERSFDILATDPKIFTVWLRAHNDLSNHPIDYGSYNSDVGFYLMSRAYTYWHSGYAIQHTWCGVTLNPGLRRVSDAMLVHPFSVTIPYDKCSGGVVGEYDINVTYGEMGFYGAITDMVDGYVKHIGWDHHVIT